MRARDPGGGGRASSNGRLFKRTPSPSLSLSPLLRANAASDRLAVRALSLSLSVHAVGWARRANGHFADSWKPIAKMCPNAWPPHKDVSPRGYIWDVYGAYRAPDFKPERASKPALQCLLQGLYSLINGNPSRIRREQEEEEDDGMSRSFREVFGTELSRFYYSLCCQHYFLFVFLR